MQINVQTILVERIAFAAVGYIIGKQYVGLKWKYAMCLFFLGPVLGWIAISLFVDPKKHKDDDDDDDDENETNS